MKYLNTKFKLFIENKKEDGINKYEIVQFKENYTIENVYGIDKNISINVNKGERVKLYFDISESTDENYNIIGIRPIETFQTEKKTKEEAKEKTVFRLSELWEANFILDTPMIINKNKSPFEIEKYI